MDDLVIVGGGPAGAAAALHARRSGMSVRILERGPPGRDKTCGDGLTTNALRQLAELGLDPSGLPSWLTLGGLRVHPPRGRPVDLRLPNDGSMYLAMVQRAELDGRLLDMAALAGASVEFGVRVVSIEVSGDGLPRAHGSDGTAYPAHFVVVASGARTTPSLPSFDTPDPRATPDDLLATRAYAKGVEMEPLAHIVFAPDVLPGYAWVFPQAGGGANVGVALHRATSEPGEAVRHTRKFSRGDRFARIAGPGAEPVDDRVMAWPIPSTIPDSVATGRVFKIGDAAGICDPMTGEGIGQALASAELAVASLTTQSPATAADHYATALRRHFHRDQATARRLLRVLESPSWSRRAVRFMGITPMVARYFARWTIEEFPRSSIRYPSTFARSLRKPRGAQLRAGSGRVRKPGD